MKSLIPIVLLALLATACEETPAGPVETMPPPPPAAFRTGDFVWSTIPGPSAILGVVSYHVGPTRFSCDGEDVILTPETPWTRRRMSILYGSATSAAVPVAVVRSRIPSAPNGDYVRYVRKTTCGDNHFAFANLPEGGWFVITLAKPIGAAGDTVAVMRRVETRGGRREVSLP